MGSQQSCGFGAEELSDYNIKFCPIYLHSARSNGRTSGLCPNKFNSTSTSCGGISQSYSAYGLTLNDGCLHKRKSRYQIQARKLTVGITNHAFCSTPSGSWVHPDTRTGSSDSGETHVNNTERETFFVSKSRC